MAKYVLKKLLEYLLILFVVSFIMFFMIHLSPTEPLSVILGGKASTPEQIASARAKFHLDEPLIMQYFIWLKGVVQGDFGISYKYQTSVLESIASRAAITLGLVVGGFILSICVAIPMGVFSAMKKNTSVDRIRSTCEDMLGFLAERTALAEDEITMLLSVVGDCQACVACSQESQTFRLAMPRYVLEAYGFTWPLDR